MLRYNDVRLIVLAGVLMTCMCACNGELPVDPPTPPVADTTSQDWDFTMYRLAEGYHGNYPRDIFALSPDYIILSGYNMGPTNARLWNGASLEYFRLPFRPLGLPDTSRFRLPEIGQTWPDIYGLWFFRKDNFWMAHRRQVQHTTIAGGDRDTMILATSREHVPEIGGSHIWAQDSALVYFAKQDASAVFRWRHSDRSWQHYELSYPPMSWANRVYDFWGTSNENIFLHTNGGLKRFDGLQWHTIWDRNMPSMCDSVYFGLPMSSWAVADEDSMWITGLFIGRMRKDGSGRVTYIAKPEVSAGDFSVRFVRGTAANNVFFVGPAGYIAHYNGASFKVFSEFRNQGISFRRAVVFEDEVFIIGEGSFGGGAFVHGRRR